MSFSRFMRRNGYKYLILRCTTTGAYNYRDSEWNYSDIPHLNYVHTKVEGYSFYSDNERIVNMFMQKFGPFCIPVTNYIEHTDMKKHSYVMNILGMVVSVTTTHQNEDIIKAKTTTEYKFFYRNFLEKLFAIAIKFATRKNYKVLMSEDVPMRIQRGLLRKNKISFRSDKSNKIGFSETEDLNKVNVDATNFFKLKKSFLVDINFKEEKKHIKELFLTVINFNNQISLLGDICQHEGANLSYEYDTKIKKCRTACPWHGKVISPLLVINKSDRNNHKFTYLNQRFNVQIISQGLLINII